MSVFDYVFEYVYAENTGVGGDYEAALPYLVAGGDAKQASSGLQRQAGELVDAESLVRPANQRHLSRHKG